MQQREAYCATTAQQFDNEFHQSVERMLELKYAAAACQDFMLASFWRDSSDYLTAWYFEMVMS